MTPEAKQLFTETIAKLRAENLAGNSSPLHRNAKAELRLEQVLLEYTYALSQLPADSFTAADLTPKELTEAQKAHMDEIAFRLDRESAMVAMDKAKSEVTPSPRAGKVEPSADYVPPQGSSPYVDNQPVVVPHITYDASPTEIPAAPLDVVPTPALEPVA